MRNLQEELQGFSGGDARKYKNYHKTANQVQTSADVDIKDGFHIKEGRKLCCVTPGKAGSPEFRGYVT